MWQVVHTFWLQLYRVELSRKEAKAFPFPSEVGLMLSGCNIVQPPRNRQYYVQIFVKLSHALSMSNVKCHVSNIKCRMSKQLILEISADLMGPQKILGDLSRSCEISRDLMRSQLG